MLSDSLSRNQSHTDKRPADRVQKGESNGGVNLPARKQPGTHDAQRQTAFADRLNKNFGLGFGESDGSSNDYLKWGSNDSRKWVRMIVVS